MKEFLFEEKGTWVKLNLESMKYAWDSNELNYKKWPKNIRRSYAKAILNFAKEIPDEKKLEMFFYAKGVANQQRLYKEYIRKIEWPYSEEELSYINQTESEAESFFGIKLKNDLL